MLNDMIATGQKIYLNILLFFILARGVSELKKGLWKRDLILFLLGLTLNIICLFILSKFDMKFTTRFEYFIPVSILVFVIWVGLIIYYRR